MFYALLENVECTILAPEEIAKKAAATKKKAGRPRTDKILAFTAIQKVVRAVHAGTKKRELRTRSSVQRRIGMLPVAGGTLCLLAGRYVVWCVIEDVDDRDEIEDIVTVDNYHEFVPWADSHDETLSLYAKLLENDGSGYVSMLVSRPYKTLNLD